jgi:aminomethyltransferase
LPLSQIPETLLKTPLHDLHVSLGARMVPFAGYAMPVQYPSGLMAEHLHTRASASLFDVSHMGQLRLVGPDAAAAFETLMPMDVIDLALYKQRYGLLLNDEGGILDDLMFIKREGLRGGDIFIIVNGACKAGDIALIEQKIGHRCQVIPMPQMALMALQGPKAVEVMKRLCPGIERLVFMTGGNFNIACDSHGPHQSIECFVTRSGYTGEDGFEISVHEMKAEALAHALLAQAEVKPAGLGARNSLRLEAGLCLYGHDIDSTTTPVQAGLTWAIQKVRRAGGAREGGFPGATTIVADIKDIASAKEPILLRKRVGLLARERVPVRDHTELQNMAGERIGEVTSGLLAPSLDKPVAMAYVKPEYAALGTVVNAIVRGKPVPMQVSPMPFVPTRYYRG